MRGFHESVWPEMIADHDAAWAGKWVRVEIRGAPDTGTTQRPTHLARDLLISGLDVPASAVAA